MPTADAMQRYFAALTAADKIILYADQWQSFGRVLEFCAAESYEHPILFIVPPQAFAALEEDQDLRYYRASLGRPDNRVATFSFDQPFSDRFYVLTPELNRFLEPPGLLRCIAARIRKEKSFGRVVPDASHYRGLNPLADSTPN